MKQFYCLVLLALLFGFSASAQVRVTGTVTGAEDGKPIAFASVTVKGATTAATTGDDGTYTITVPDGKATLVFNFFGMKSHEEVVGERNIINASLENEAFTLDETIVVAYGTAKKGTFTGSANVLKADKIKDAPVTSFQNALGGQVAGLQFSQTSGQAGSSSEIRIRGMGSMNASNEPLYVIDGVPVISGDASQLSYVSNNVMSSLNPADIESITVLKDAAASALYGSRAANGVIMITTKKGQKGSMKVSLNASLGFTPSFAYNNFETASPEQQHELMLENRYNGYLAAGNTPAVAMQKSQDLLDSYLPKDPRGYFDWENALFRTAVYQNYDVSVSGANDFTNYYSSIAYTKDEGRSYNNEMERINARLNVTQKIGKYVELGSKVNVSHIRKTGFNDTYNTGSNYFFAIRNLLFEDLWPTNIDGTPVTDRFRSYAYNYLHYDNLKDLESKMVKLSATESVQVNILPDLTFRSVFSFDQARSDDRDYYSPTHYAYSGTGGRITEYTTNVEKLVSSSTISYDKSFAEKHSINLLAGWEAERNITSYKMARGTWLPSESARTVETAGQRHSEGYNWGYNMLSFLSRVEYNYDNKYYASASYRRDGSSRFGPDTRWGNFWSVAGSWRIKNENFLKDVAWISNLRLRASYGVNGTMPKKNYEHMSLYKFGFNYNEKPGGIVDNVADRSLTWESNYTTNIALETSFFSNRLSLNVEYFNRDSKDLLQEIPIPYESGFTKMLTNFGEINNKGFEIEVSGDVVKTKDWTWNLGANISLVKSKVTKLYGGEDIIWYDPTGGDKNAQFIYREGKSPLSFWGWEWAGVDPDNGKGMWYLNNSKTPDKTVNGRPVTYTKDKADNVIMGCADPDFYGGINTTVAWRDISLSANFIYSVGGDAFNRAAWDNQDDGYYSSRLMSKAAMSRWQKPGDISSSPIRTYDAPSARGYQSRWLETNNYLRLKTITLSYRLPKSILSKTPINSVRVYASATNLFTVANIDEYDPEVNQYGVRGWEMPQGKTYTFGISVDF